MVNRLQMGSFFAEEFASGQWKAYLKEPDYKALTGSEDKLKLTIPFPHRINRIIIGQTNSSNASSVNPLDIEVRRDNISGSPYLKEYLNVQADLLDGYWTITGGLRFECEADTWIISLTGTATDRVRFAIYFQRLN